ncbi:DUF2961 domain-containing protein [Pedobacter ginsengisoli]|uniref:DUF2961 domain-containing protein n=1 Tax=Pedobacter ginsengisoli TaxID=363852 RepID=UPI00254C23C9|nr:DUF2961 domain-containing protein [Pedobacter ginsengisoli]
MKTLCCLLMLMVWFPPFELLAQDTGAASGLPSVPHGYDAYRRWDLLPLQRIGVRAYMRSTHDRLGGNHHADAGHFLFMNKEDENVTLDVKGNGVFYFFRANHWHGSPWHFVVDGKDNLVKETGTSDPANAKKKFKDTSFIPESAFPAPLAWTWSTTKGADLIWTPMPFQDSLRIAYSRTFYGTGYYIYHLYANEPARLQSWDMTKTPDQDVTELLSRSGTDIAPKDIEAVKGKVKLNKKDIVLARIKEVPSTVRALKLTLPLDKALDLERIRLQITWDNAKYPSVDAPLCLFFGAGTFYNRENKEYLVKAFPVNIRYDYPNKKVELACYYPMPFFKNAKVELKGINPEDSSTEIDFEIRYEPLRWRANHTSYFHATYKDIPEPELGQDMTYLDTRGIEGHKDWSGNFVGTSFIFSHQANLGTLEGDPRFFFDDSESPQAYGTGTEEWGGGGDYWGGENMTLPFAGHPCGAPGKNKSRHEKDLIESGYRFLIADLMPFGKRAVIKFEHGGENLATEHYEAVAYWYGLPAPSLIQTDEIDIGNPESEKSHSYHSPAASEAVSLTSRYELGIDTFPAIAWGLEAAKIPGYQEKSGKEVYPVQTMNGRFTHGVSEFTVRLDLKNTGALLRRTLDYSFPNQTAEVFIGDASAASEADIKWEKAGIWYLSGSNTAVFSSPNGETGSRKTTVETSNRCFRDDEFLIPARLTQNKKAVRVRIKFVPNNQQLYPGFPFPKESAWSEFQYKVYSYVLPDFRK